jgi:hypothetical protein
MQKDAARNVSDHGLIRNPKEGSWKLSEAL